MADITNRDDFIDTRDLIKAIEDLEGDREAYQEDVENAESAYDDFIENSDDEDPEASQEARELADDIDKARRALTEWEEDEAEELAALKAFAEQVEGYCPDYLHGETLIRETYFTEYAEDLVKDAYGLPSDLPSFIVIDWEATAENVKQDYSEAEYDGVTYYFR
ncbi:hypothetical protein [Erythrobacter phage vB_EliS-L02]|nr:hypothetical protein [Erythrobacter phage vB_EliS-L02]